MPSNWPVFHQMRLAQFLTWDGHYSPAMPLILTRPTTWPQPRDRKIRPHDGLHRAGRFHEEHRAVIFRVSLKSAWPVRNRSSPSRSAWAKDFRRALPQARRGDAPHSPPPKTHHLPPHSKPICAASLVRIPTRPSNVRSDDWRARRSQPATQYH